MQALAKRKLRHLINHYIERFLDAPEASNLLDVRFLLDVWFAVFDTASRVRGISGLSNWARLHLFTVTNWTNFHRLSLAEYPNLATFMGCVAARPAPLFSRAASTGALEPGS